LAETNHLPQDGASPAREDRFTVPVIGSESELASIVHTTGFEVIVESATARGRIAYKDDGLESVSRWPTEDHSRLQRNDSSQERTCESPRLGVCP